MWRSYFIGLSFLVIYLMTTFRYLAPVVHYQLDYAYISEVLCINRDKPQLQCLGKCQLRKKVMRLSQHQQQKETLLQHLICSFNPVESVPDLLALLPPLPESLSTSSLSVLHTPGTCSAALPAPFHPPRHT
ncbi:hypothetical protein POKO110462_17530 [Pontibacter korlensis]|uniref:hypothetical protein n=1 Tax=Pontibacter korlensis TaxID=400092 RepID=UPI000697E1E7|nr:hypothetical protein [Pontibacter korlensis]